MGRYRRSLLGPRGRPPRLVVTNLVRVSSSAMDVVDDSRKVVGLLPRGEWGTDNNVTAANPVAVKAEQGPTPRNYD